MIRRDVRDAVQLMEKAWATRYAAMTSPPQSEEQRAQLVAQVRQDLVQAVAICREVGARRELVDALRKLGHVEQEMGRSDVTRTLYEEAVAVSRAQDDPLLLAHAVRHLGDIHRNLGHEDAAASCYKEALTLYRSHAQPPPLDFANAIRPMAILRENAGMDEEARQLWREARDLYETVNVQEGVTECSDHLARLGA